MDIIFCKEGGEILMDMLMLNGRERDNLKCILRKLERIFGDTYNYVPAEGFASCTCQGNCDGPTGASTCQWG